MYNNEAKPFIKWAGGKAKMLSVYGNYYPAALENGAVNRYIETCVGGGAVLFDLMSRYNFVEVIINDINRELINCYQAVQNRVSPLIAVLEEWQQMYNLISHERQQNMYYRKREEFNIVKNKEHWSKNDELNLAALMLFLNRTCFNGLYRENRKGDFNVPFNKVDSIHFDFENLYIVGEILKSVKILCTDFENLTPYITNRTFVYADPPYRPVGKLTAFTDFTKNAFDEEAQKRLGEWSQKVDEMGGCIMLSNSDPQTAEEEDTFFEELYREFEIIHVSGKRNISSKGSGRGKKGDLLIKNHYETGQVSLEENQTKRDRMENR